MPILRHLSTFSRASLLTAVHKTSNLIPRILPPGWTSPCERLESSPPPARILICGLDKHAGSEHLVTALLSQPFLSDDSTLNTSLQTRWKDHTNTKITIAYGKQVKWDGSKLYIPSSFLQQFPFPVEIEEYAAADRPESLEQATWTADVPLVLCNPVTTSVSSVHLPSENSNTRLVVTGNSPVPDGTSPHILFIDPLRAIDGLAAVNSDSTSPLNIQRYQDNFVSSNLPTLASHIKQSLLDTSSPSLEYFQARRLTTQLIATLNALSSAISRAQRQTDDALTQTTLLYDLVNETYVREPVVVLGIGVGGKEGSLITKALTTSTREMHTHMDKFSWLKMISHVDEINVVVDRLVDDVWCKELEQQLIYQTGRLTTIQTDFTSRTSRALDTETFKTPPFNSPVLRNELQQLVQSPTYLLTPTSLTSPIHTRRAQIAAYPTVRLHLAGQRAVLGMGASLTAGVGLGWAGWLGWLTGSGNGLLGIVAMDATTSIGLGLLTAVAGIRWSVGKWERAKKSWWGDWARIGDGLERDLVASLDHTLKHQVCAYPIKAHEGISELVPKRVEEIVQLREEVEGIRKDLNKEKDKKPV